MPRTSHATLPQSSSTTRLLPPRHQVCPRDPGSHRRGLRRPRPAASAAPHFDKLTSNSLKRRSPMPPGAGAAGPPRIPRKARRRGPVRRASSGRRGPGRHRGRHPRCRHHPRDDQQPATPAGVSERNRRDPPGLKELAGTAPPIRHRSCAEELESRPTRAISM